MAKESELELSLGSDFESDEVETPQPRETRKRQLTFYDEDSSDDEPQARKMTQRQRARREMLLRNDEETFQEAEEKLQALNKKMSKRKETAEEAALRKAETARRRAHYKLKQLEEEKRDTLNKLLKRRATKTREKQTEESQEPRLALKPRRPQQGHPALYTWVSRADGERLRVPVLEGGAREGQ